MKELIELAVSKGFTKWFEDYSEQAHHLDGWRDFDRYLDEVELPEDIMLGLIQKFLREEYKMYVNAIPSYADNSDNKKHLFEVSYKNKTKQGTSEGHWYYDSYEEALKNGIEYCLKTL